MRTTSNHAVAKRQRHAPKSSRTTRFKPARSTAARARSSSSGERTNTPISYGTTP